MEAIESSKLIAQAVFNKILEEVKWNNDSRWLISVNFSKHVKNISDEILDRYKSIEFRYAVLIELKSEYIFYLSQHNSNSIFAENILKYIDNRILLEIERKETILINSEMLQILNELANCIQGEKNGSKILVVPITLSHKISEIIEKA